MKISNMRSGNKTIFQLLAIFLNVRLKFEFVETCSLADNELPKIQVLFLVDGELSPGTNLAEVQQIKTKEIMRLTKLKQPNAEFGLAAYYSWQDDLTGKEGNCYNTIQSFTGNPEEIMNQIEKLPGVPINNVTSRECSYAMAIVLAITDTNLKWNKDPAPNSTAAPTAKFIVGYPLKVSTTEIKNSTNRRDPIGDGSDTCHNSNPPGPDFLLDIVYRNNIYVFTYAYVSRDEENEQMYQCYDPIISPGSPFHKLWEFHWRDITPCYQELEGCKNRTDLRNQFEVSKKRRRNNLLDYSKESWQEFLRFQAEELFEGMMVEYSKCDWEFEQGYNTLGL